MDYYVLEKLAAAVRSLVGPEPVQERLRWAAVALLALDHKPFDNAGDLLRYTTVMEKLTSGEDEAADLRAMSNVEARDLAREILEPHESSLAAWTRQELLVEMLRGDSGEQD